MEMKENEHSEKRERTKHANRLTISKIEERERERG